ncbi:hypothetical protein FHW36_102249 [Chitinophaga polysaccharea]|uniref:Uncharacterized protein n=1 Tax=Chitinophaga polysaccharea TaxID=1293035 RepID=A0A561PWJ8_9BACT|nr:hypothetical protein FHW36_102249 [Chitinophaga polysaccharea]
MYKYLTPMKPFYSSIQVSRKISAGYFYLCKELSSNKN